MIFTLSRHATIRFASNLLVVLGLMTLVYGANAFMLPLTEPDQWDWLMSADNYSCFAKHWRGIGMQSIGLGLFLTVTALTSFRKGEKWAWFVFWFWPVFFLFTLADNWHGFIFLLPLVVLSFIALLSSFKAFFPN